jgi:hypothetical protein
MIVIGLFRSTWKRKRKWFLVIPLVILAVVIYMANFKMAADAMFRQPKQLLLTGSDKNKVDTNRLVIGVSNNGEDKAYPIQFLGYHHHIQDTVGGEPIMVTYCTVCRTGRVFQPVVNGKKEKFRLVGMDHFNAMLEDATTKSWWRQATGEAIAGKLKGQRLPELFSTQTTLAAWLKLHPNTLIMQADPAFTESYGKTTKYEDGTSRDILTGTDSLSWKDKSWVIGINLGKEQKAYDWNQLKKERIINDKMDGLSFAIILADDNKSFFAFERPGPGNFSLHADTLIYASTHYKLDGRGIDTDVPLKSLPVSQEFWHSWRTFNPATKKY